MSGVLARIVAAKQAEIQALRERGPRPNARVRAPLSLTAALRREQGERLRLMLEHKRKSPSAGALSTALTPGARALAYARGGAAAISVLTDSQFFDGSYDHVTEIHRTLHRAGSPAPVLAKEFVLDPIQIDEAHAAGADAVLLIARLLDPATLESLHAYARRRGLDALVEVHTEAEAEHASRFAWLIGVNARDLDSLVMDVERAHGILVSFAPEIVSVHLSGLSTPEAVHRLAEGPAAAALVGEVLMREDDPAAKLASLVAASKPAPSPAPDDD